MDSFDKKTKSGLRFWDLVSPQAECWCGLGRAAPKQGEISPGKRTQRWATPPGICAGSPTTLTSSSRG
eukprot:6991370-Prymnesium_polylepis.1